MFIGSMTCVNHDENCNKLQWHRWKNHTWIVRLCGSNLQIQTQHVALHALLSTPCSPRLYSFTPHSTRDASHSIFYTPKLRTPQSMHLALHTLRPTLNIQHFPPEVQHSTLPTPHFTVQTPHYTPQSPLHLKLGTLHSAYHLRIIMHSALFTLHSARDTPVSTLCTPQSPLHMLHSNTLQSTLSTLYSTLHILQSTIDVLHVTLRTPLPSTAHKLWKGWNSSFPSKRFAWCAFGFARRIKFYLFVRYIEYFLTQFFWKWWRKILQQHLHDRNVLSWYGLLDWLCLPTVRFRHLQGRNVLNWYGFSQSWLFLFFADSDMCFVDPFCTTCLIHFCNDC